VVDLAEHTRGIVDEPLDCPRDRHIGGSDVYSDPALSQLACRALQTFLISGAEAEVTALSGEALADGLADSPGATRDHRDLPGEA
jgi:hypothetical protein